MISLFGSTYSALFPWLLGLIPLVTLFLIYIYKHRGKGKRIVVSTILILKNIRSKTEARSKFFPPPRFFFELLILLLLVLGTAGFFESLNSHKIIMLLDNSFSMSAEDVSGTNNFFTLAKDEAIKILNEASSGVEVKVFTTSPNLKELTRNWENKKKAIELISDIQCMNGEDNLGGAIESLLKSGEGKIYVITDKALGIIKASDNNLEKIKFINVNKNDKERANIAITDINYNKVKKESSVEIVSYAPIRVTANVEGFALFNKQGFVSKKSLGVKSIVLTPNVKANVNFEIPVDAKAFSAFVTEKNEFKRYDNLSGDNSAWLSFEGENTNVVLVSNDTPEKLGLTKLSNLKIKTISLEEYENNPSVTSDASFLIFHLLTPKVVPTKSALIISPQNDGFVSISDNIQEAHLTNWNSSHPLLKYLNIPSMDKIPFQPINPVAGLRDIIRTDTGIALSAGKIGQAKIVISAFEIFPFEGKKDPILSIFTLNIFNWLLEGQIGLGYIPVYSKLSNNFIEQSDIKYVDSIKQKDLDEVKDGILKKVGLIKIRKDDLDNFIAVNFFNEAESNIFNQAKIDIPELLDTENHNSDSGVSLVRYLILSSLILLLLDCCLGFYLSRQKV